jgi:hypothetical protein
MVFEQRGTLLQMCGLLHSVREKSVVEGIPFHLIMDNRTDRQFPRPKATQVAEKWCHYVPHDMPPSSPYALKVTEPSWYSTFLDPFLPFFLGHSQSRTKYKHLRPFILSLFFPHSSVLRRCWLVVPDRTANPQCGFDHFQKQISINDDFCDNVMHVVRVDHWRHYL